MSHAWLHGESSSDKWPIIDSNKSEAYSGTIPMIKYWGEDKYNLFRFEPSWRWKVMGGCVKEGDIPDTPTSAS